MFNIDKIYNIASMSAFVIVLSVFYQVGYFSKLGVEFISFIGTYDIIIFAAFMFPILNSILIISQIIGFKAHKHDNELSFIAEIFFPFRKLGQATGGDGSFILFLILLLIAFVRFYYDLDYFGGFMFIFLYVFVVAYWISSVVYDLSIYGDTDLKKLGSACFFTVYLSYVCGQFYSEFHAGRECRIDVGEKVKIVTFYRKVSDGIIIRYNDDIEFVQMSSFGNLRCRIENLEKEPETGNI